jgi:SAM-dependent methyltransferase
MKRTFRRLTRSIRRHGLIGSFKLAIEYFYGLLVRLRPSVRSALRQSEERAFEFDSLHGIDTSGHIHQTDLDVKNPNQLHAVAYGGSDPGAFRDAINILSIDYKRFAFLDFGSGKGRAILLATEFPFRRIVGIEFSVLLNSIACENIKLFRSDAAKCNNVTSVCMDVLDFPIPDDPLVCYFCNPFDAALMSKLLIRIEESYHKQPREIFLVYYNPKEAHVMDGSGIFKQIMKRGQVWIWRAPQ